MEIHKYIEMYVEKKKVSIDKKKSIEIYKHM